MLGAIVIEIGPFGLTRVAVVVPKDAAKGEKLWLLHNALRPQIEALEVAAREHGPRVAFSNQGGGE